MSVINEKINYENAWSDKLSDDLQIPTMIEL